MLSGTPATTLEDLNAALPSLRPELHRYCARMAGSVVEGEDVMQDALLKASQALSDGVVVENLRAWLFRIAHNSALNALRSRRNDQLMKDEIGREPASPEQMPMHSEVADNLRPFLGLTPRQRSAVVLRDVLGYSTAEVADLTDSSVQSVKSALHRGRVLLRNTRPEEENALAQLSEEDRDRLSAYTDYFNAHEFDRLRDMLSDEVRLDLVSVESRKGRPAVGGYYSNYSRRQDWIMAPGCVEGRLAMLAFDREDPSGAPIYFVLIEFIGGEVRSIRDFRYARYAMADARWVRFPRLDQPD